MNILFRLQNLKTDRFARAKAPLISFFHVLLSTISLAFCIVPVNKPSTSVTFSNAKFIDLLIAQLSTVKQCNLKRTISSAKT